MGSLIPIPLVGVQIRRMTAQVLLPGSHVVESEVRLLPRYQLNEQKLVDQGPSEAWEWYSLLGSWVRVCLFDPLLLSPHNFLTLT